MIQNDRPIEFPKLAILGFVAGFLATITFHQMALWVLWQAGVAPFSPYVFTAIPPFGLPAVISLAIWGGVWGVLFALIQHRFSRHRYWATAFVFGAVFPSLVALLIVLPLKGKPLGGGWHWPLLITAFLINGVWGIGTAGIFGLATARHRHATAGEDECVAGAPCHR